MIRQALHDGSGGASELLALLESTLDASTEGILVTDVYLVTPDNSEHLAVVKTGQPIRDLSKMHFTAGAGQPTW